MILINCKSLHETNRFFSIGGYMFRQLFLFWAFIFQKVFVLLHTFYQRLYHLIPNLVNGQIQRGEGRVLGQSFCSRIPDLVNG